MGLLIGDAWAQAAPAAGQEPGLMGFLPLVILFVVFYFFLIRPQMRRQKEHQKLVQGLAKGDEVVTNGGLLGRIIEVREGFVKVEFAQGFEAWVQRHAVGNVLPKGTMKEL